MMHPGKKVSLVFAVAMTLGLGVPQASAQGLFDRLFGGGVRYAPRDEYPRERRDFRRRRGGPNSAPPRRSAALPITPTRPMRSFPPVSPRLPRPPSPSASNPR